ncbi:hypothetical protein RJ640_004213 [Escallonia rubra]|uniref:Transposase (putative) gypsy type domain-containing protein n=1 Tax=Escallonia rubra TaxID=112253 RepID=A0AA88UBZ9_9ASTE|nr:hypothetical protein RJ640_004213 [Escallonia rubra]
MTKEELEALLKEYPLPGYWIARVQELQKLANYMNDWETDIYEEQLRSGYRFPLHPFALKMFDHYKMAGCHLVPNGWRKLVGLIYLVETSGELLDLSFVGYPFTWNNHRHGNANIRMHLDRAFANPARRINFSTVLLHHLKPGGSDHVPILLNFLGTTEGKGDLCSNHVTGLDASGTIEMRILKAIGIGVKDRIDKL